MSEWDHYFENEDLDSTTFRLNTVENIDLGKAPSQEFTDSIFSPDVKSLVGSYNNEDSLVSTVKDWYRIRDLNPRAQLFVDGTEAGDIKQ